MKTKLLKTSLAAAALLATTQSNAAEVSGRMDLSVTMPEILVIYHYDLVNIEFTGITYDTNPDTVAEADYERQLGTYGTTVTGPAFSTLNHTVGIATLDTGLPELDDVDVTLEDVWAIRAISSNTLTVTADINNATLTHPTATPASTITVSAPLLDADNVTSGANSAALVVPAGWAANVGDLTFTLDLSTVNASGAHTTTSVTDDTFLLKLTSS